MKPPPGTPECWLKLVNRERFAENLTEALRQSNRDLTRLAVVDPIAHIAMTVRMLPLLERLPRLRDQSDITRLREEVIDAISEIAGLHARAVELIKAASAPPDPRCN